MEPCKGFVIVGCSEDLRRGLRRALGGFALYGPCGLGILVYVAEFWAEGGFAAQVITPNKEYTIIPIV